MSVVAGSRSRAASSSATSSSAASTVRFSDPRLYAMAADASAALRWDALWQQVRRPSTRWRRRRAAASASTGTVTDSALYTREDPLSFSVLASALLRCSVQELRLVFDARTSEQFADVMRALSPRDLRAAELVHVAGTSARSHSRSSRAASEQSTSSASSASRSATSSSAAADAFTTGGGEHLAVTAMTLESSGVFARCEQWCFLEHIEESDAQSKSGRWFTKTLLALPPAECLGGRVGARRTTKNGHDVLVGLRFEEELEGRSTRALFSGELFYDGSDSGKDGASHRQVRARLLKMAEWVDRVAVVVRRRRLGIQVLADRQLGKAANATCVCCRRSFLLARKKSCALCGFNVCERCSAAEQRETCADTYARSVITSVRVCDLCMVRVDQCRYTKVTPRDLKPASVVADDVAANGRRSRASTTTTGVVLTQLLQETMASASPTRKQSVLSVIKYLVAQDARDDSSSGQHSRVSRAVTLTDTSTEAQHFAALQVRLNDHPLPLEQCVLANADKRAYPLAYPSELESPVAFPVPASEQRRVQLVREEQYVPPNASSTTTLAGAPLQMDAVPELDIICAIARKEMACSGSLITLVDQETMHVVSSTLDVFAHQSFPREQGFCAQTIMSDQPLLVLRPEADARFSRLVPVANMGVRFYCGFPLLAEDGTVIGSMCCVAHEPRTLSQSQYTVMTKLAQTASRVVQVQAKARRQEQQRRRHQHPTTSDDLR